MNLRPRLASFSLSFLILILTAGGCVVQPKAGPAPIWPGTFSGRRFFNKHGVIIYARNASVAESNARHIVELGQEFTRNTAGQPLNGLVIINDDGDTQIGNLDLDKLMPQEKQEPQLIEMGFTMQEFVLAMGLPLTKEQIGRNGGFSAAALRTVQWVVSIPSQRRIEQFGDHLIDAGLKKQNFNFFQRMLILPFMPLIHSLINDAMNAESDTAVYGCFCQAQANWSEDRRKQAAADYAEKRMGMVVNSLKAATQQVTGGNE